MRLVSMHAPAIALVLAFAVVATACSDDDSLPQASPPDPVSTTPSSASGQVAVTPDQATSGANHHNFAEEGITRIDPIDARYALDADVATFVDVRDAHSYDTAHIPGAISIPLEELPDRVRELDPAKIIITYCT